RPATPEDEPFLWTMLFEAAYAAEAGLREPGELRGVPALARYVEGWGRPTDLGVVAVGAAGNGAGDPVGAAWARLLAGDEAGYGHVDDDTPELSIAVAPGRRAGGVGELMLSALVTRARSVASGLSLSVRAGNPARRLDERAGFRPVAGRETIGSSGSTSITMLLRF